MVMEVGAQVRTEAVPGVNCVHDHKRLSQFAEKVLHNLAASPSSTEQMSTDDIQKYAAAFQIDLHKFSAIHRFFKEFWICCVYLLWKPTFVEERLKEYGIENQGLVTALVEVWTKNAKTVTDKIKSRSTASQCVKDVQWSVNVDVCSDKRLAINEPMGIVDFTVDSQGNDKHLAVEMDHTDLLNLYNHLENIQMKLDSLMS